MSWNQQGGGKPQQNAYEPDVFTDNKIKLYGKPLQEGAWSPMLRIKMSGNNPVVECSTGLKDPKGRPVRIDTPMSPVTLYQLLNVIDSVANSKAATSYELENWGHEFKWDPDQSKSVRSPERSVISRFSVEKTEEGVVKLTIAGGGRNRNVVPFEFGGDDWHKWMKDGNYVPEAGQSVIAVKAWTDVIRRVYISNFIHGWEEPAYERERRLQRIAAATGQGGGGKSYGGGGKPNGGYNNNQGGAKPQYNNNHGQQPQRPAAPPQDFGDMFDDDVPM